MKETGNNRAEIGMLGKYITFWIILGLTCFSFSAPAMADDEDELADDSLIGRDIEELMEIHIRPTATLTKTSHKITPAAMTIITKEDIENSGARSLDELLDIYVPNFQMILHIYETRHLGLRGTMSDRDDKYLLLVNGRVMNDRMHYGALSERDLPMLGDINRVEVVRGPGSAMYGPGALFMVINIITDSPRTFEGTEVRSRLGAIDEFYTWEAKWGKRFKDDSGLLIYAGAAKQPGTDPDDARFTPGKPFTYGGHNYTGRESWDLNAFEGYNQGWRGLEKIKLYSQYVRKNLNFWFRYTRGGSYYPLNADWLDTVELRQGEGYQQLTFFVGNKLQVSKTIDVDYSFSYDTLDFVRHLTDNIASHRQDEYHSKVILNWQPHENHSIAVGGEYSHEEFGFDTRGYPHSYADSATFSFLDGERMPRWSTDTSSVLGEYQWKIFPKWTIFLGGRIDWHRFVKREMFSPRAALVYTPTKKDTLKFMAQRSVRASTAENMKYVDDPPPPAPAGASEKSDYETMDYYEIRWERQHSKKLWIAVSGFYTAHKVIGWSSGTYAVSPLGKIRIYGAEVEATYKTDKSKFTLSHGYTKLDGMKLEVTDPLNPTIQFFTSEPYGYGDDLANWSNHMSKLTGHYDVTEKLSLDGSLNIYWGFPGKKDYAVFRDITYGNRYSQGFDAPFRSNIYLNLGMGYKFNENCRVRVNAHNILGWIDDRYNKRNYGFGDAEGAFTTEAAAISVSLVYRF